MPPMMRTFLSQPSLSADWSGDYEEKSAEWFELFLDLVMVAACSNVAEALKEDLSVRGFVYFVFLTTVYTVTWTQYTNFHARFNEKSLLHYAYLYLWLVGLGGMVLAGAPGVAFTLGMSLVRLAQLLMYMTIYIHLPIVRPNVHVDIVVSIVSATILLTSLALPPAWTIPAYGVTMLVETVGRIGLALARWFVPKELHRIPLNIDHYSDRVGCLVLVTLGEAVVSAIIHFDTPELLTARFFVMMQLALLVLFSTAMFYFAIRPMRDFHALRRSSAAGFAFAWLHYALYPTLLSIGVALKFITGAVLTHTPLESVHLWLLFGSISAAMLIFLGLRVAHFGGREPAPTDADSIKRVKYAWWGIIALSPLFPLACVAVLEGLSPQDADPILALSLAAAFNVLWTIAETAMMNRLVELGHDHRHWGKEESAPLFAADESDVYTLP
ncbi:Aste57867_14814 [Aphanomyces stellatus]|uniref:Aste57867_14814 protein n=1 Tax=Aphanomyces stellatus TaxID=120398 RepID=A0A485L4A9_9STRA|nr:hypothetical protein As57867_014758 [Aphanomyces stellatus]VFT91632.1 Aste57867_14814 [Aphanomyces stellatus]